VKLITAFLVLAVVSAVAIGGCGSSGNDQFRGSAGDASFAGDVPNFSSSGASGGDGSTQGLLSIMPVAPVVAVTTGSPVPTVQFTAYLSGKPVSVVWAIDRGELGTIDTHKGLFTPSGTIGGTGNVTAILGSNKATTTVTVTIATTQKGDPAWQANPPPPGAGGYAGVGGDGAGGPPSTAQVTTLSGTPTADASVTLLYPYDGTVWPKGLLAPLLQWNAGAHSFDSVYVHIQEKAFEYKGYFAANKMPFVNLPIPQQAWQTMSLSNGGDPVTITLVFGEGAKAVGPYTEKWTIAQATLQGTIYYNSYGTALVKNSDGDDHYGNQYGAATLGIVSGATSPVLIAGVNSLNASGDGTGCRVCHTVSADGKTLVTQASNANAGDYSRTVTVNLANDTTGGAGTSLATSNLTFPALFKDGSLLFSGSGGMRNTDNSSQLYALPAGTPVAGVTGIPSGFQAALPAFSPDGKHVSFNFWGGTLTSGTSNLRSDQASLASSTLMENRRSRIHAYSTSPRGMTRSHFPRSSRTAPASSSKSSFRIRRANGDTPGDRTRASFGGSTSRVAPPTGSTS
jgi:hypothetical protein